MYHSKWFNVCFPHWASHVVLVLKSPPANAGDVRDMVSIPGSGRSPGKENGNPLQYSYLENPMDSGDWRATVYGVAKSQATKWLTLNNFLFIGRCCCPLVAQLYPLFCDPMDYSSPGSSIHETLQARILEWIAISFSRGSSWLKNRTHICVSCTEKWILYHWTTRKAYMWK